MGTFLNNRNSIYSDYEKAIEFFEMGLEVSTTAHILQRASCFEGIGDAGRYLQNVIIATENYAKAELLYRKLENYNKIATCLHRTGDLLLDQKNYTLSKSHYEKALEFYTKEKNWLFVASCLSNIGEIYVLQGRKEDGLHNFNKALALHENHKTDPKHSAFTLFEVGKLYLDSLHIPNRDKYFNKALQIVEQDNLLDGIAYGNILMANLKYNDGEYVEAKNYAKKGLRIALSYGHKIKIRMAYLIASKIYEKMGAYDEALQNYKSYREIDTQVQQKENNEFSAELETKHQVEKQNTILLQTEKEKNIAKNQRNLIIVFLFIFLFLVLILIRYQIKLKKSNKMLFQKKEEIQNMNTSLVKTVNYKNILLKEVHHRVKNNLQIICSILEMQIDSSGNSKLQEKLQTSIDRIFSMALVHEQLYSDGKDETIDAQGYFYDIINSIKSSQKFTNKKILVRLQIEAIHVNLQRALPLGMILNELITNAYKYAFDYQSDGFINVSLKSDGSYVFLDISDNGSGIDLSKARTNSIGLQLAKDFTTQIRGTFTCFVKNGTHYKIAFPMMINTAKIS
ncbi:hypothetical protein BSU00_01445 [Tenacibaculum sp. SG-28]|nr:hypothetical protein BSU00_01445 [Tenacibaculum sp. SG-28]